MQPDAHQPLYQQSEALRQVTTPSSIGSQAIEVNSLTTHRQPAVSACYGASPGWPLDSELQQGLLSANAPACPSPSLPLPEWPTFHWQQAPGSVIAFPQRRFQSHHSHHSFAQSGEAIAQPYSAGAVDPPAAASLQHYPTRHSLPHQRQLSSIQRGRTTGRGDMLQTINPLDVPLSSIAASANSDQPSWGMPSGSGREALHTLGHAGGNPTSSWTVPTQLRSENAVPAAARSLTATPAASSWAVSQPNPQNLPPRHPTQGPNPDQPASHLFLGQPSCPASRCDHPLYAHLDLSRPLCLQQPPAFGYPGISDSCRRSASPFSAQGQESSMQQKACISVSDAPHVQHQQQHAENQYQQRFVGPEMNATHAHQQGHGLVAPHLEQCGGQGQPGVTPHNADGLDCMAPELQHGWMPRGMTLQATLIACCVDQSGLLSLPSFGLTRTSVKCAQKLQWISLHAVFVHM